MNVAATPRFAPAQMALAHFFSKPKRLLIVVLAALVLLGGGGSGPTLLAPGFLAAALAAMLMDAPLLRWRKRRWVFPDGALLTGMIVGMILSRREAWYVAPATAALAVLSKHLLHGRHANIFNPAALALVVSDYLFTPGQDWWGAQPARPLELVLLGLAGAYVVRRVNRLPALLWFLGAYFLLFTVSAYFGDPRRVAEIYRLPDLGMVLFFAFFMVTDPPTSPRRGQDQIVFGLLVASTSFAVFERAGPVWFLLAGLLVGNGWEALRRWRMAASRADS